MTEPNSLPVQEGQPGVNNPGSSTDASEVSLAGSAEIANARLACRSVAAFGRLACWGLAALGVLSGSIRLAEMAGEVSPGRAGWASAILRSAFDVLAYALAGRAVSAFARLMAAACEPRFGSSGRYSDHGSVPLSRGLAAFEPIADHPEKPAGPVRPAVPSPTAELERSRSMAEIVRATMAAEWSEAEARLDEFEMNFPEGPQLSSLREELARAREQKIKESLAQLEAARQVSDADRVIEIYQELVLSLEGSDRAALDNDLAGWFLTLIRRRLRSGKVQADVVRLATRFAETFAATMEGASVRASLPTLRRSVGLCPRCAQPYAGVADACPDCLKSASKSIASPTSGQDSAPPE